MINVLVGMKQFFFLDTIGELKTTIQLKGNFVIAYSLRLWKSDDNVLELIEDIRGSCFNNSCNEICYTMSTAPDTQVTYLLELDANISTVNPITNYSILLKLEQKAVAEKLQVLGKESASGTIGFNDGGKYAQLGFSINPNSISKLVG